MKQISTIKNPALEVPHNGPGSFFELYSAKYTYRPKGESTLAREPKSPAAVVGMVPDKYIPSEGGVFKMYHHLTAGIVNYGAIKLDTCINVLEEDGGYYFENKGGEGKYILLPWDQFN